MAMGADVNGRLACRQSPGCSRTFYFSDVLEHFIYLHVCTHLRVQVHVEVRLEDLLALELEIAVNYLVQMLGTEPRSSARAVQALSHGVIFPAPLPYFNVTIH